TPTLGGQLFQCADCSGFAYRYHSCNDRHCPQCGQSDADAWLEAQKARLLLAVPYFLVTFTVPEELRLFIRSHLKSALDLLFALTSALCSKNGCSRNIPICLRPCPRRFGSSPGMWDASQPVQAKTPCVTFPVTSSRPPLPIARFNGWPKASSSGLIAKAKPV